MKIYQSKSSSSVKIMTTGVLSVLVLVTLGLVTTNESDGWIWGLVLGLIIASTVFYFYANSMNEIVVEDEGVILKKNIGQIYIPKSDIVEVTKLAQTSLTMTYGSKGVFGFIGNTMDGAISFVKDRRQMVGITTTSKKYILSSERPDELLNALRAL
ncbi:PH domain-containing protein [Gelidibacter sp.]|uniref:PH domain-containing protein n=1 Tax=Gelidibacter sp. TaxID=2018083 RepID=UPI002B64FB7E|nr:PH domain-containing protein [Gelidibacter sp.]HUH29304.1 PH domain-containing protein [Gelidibacter sp.]